MIEVTELFRRESVHHGAERLSGELILATPVSARILGGLLSSILLVAMLFASFGSYSRKESVVGWIVPEGGLIRVAARQGGTIQALEVREGDQVSAGRPLATIRVSGDIPQGDLGAAMRRDVALEVEAMEAATLASRAKLSAQRATLEARKDALQAELAEMSDRLALQRRRQEVADLQLARGEGLQAKGYLTASNLDTLRSAALGAAQDVSEIRLSILSYRRQIGDIVRDLASLPADLAAIDAEADRAKADLAGKATAVDSQSLLIATAPIAGKVVTIPVERGQFVSPGAAVVVVAPAGSSLIAELFVPSRAAGFLKAGQEVRLMYQAFPYQRFGTGKGTIETVSRSVLTPAEVSVPGGAIQEPVFRVRVRLEHAYVGAYGQNVALQPGMLLNADVIIDRRTLVQWLLDPLYAAGRSR